MNLLKLKNMMFVNSLLSMHVVRGCFVLWASHVH
jgi:hypothetical protein